MPPLRIEWSELPAVRDELFELVEHAPVAPVVAFDADSTLWLSDVANRLWDYLLTGRLLRPEAAGAVAAALASQGEEPNGDPHADMARLFELYSDGRADEPGI